MINLKSKTSTFPRNAIWPPSGWQKREKGGRIIYICLLFGNMARILGGIKTWREYTMLGRGSQCWFLDRPKGPSMSVKSLVVSNHISVQVLVTSTSPSIDVRQTQNSHIEMSSWKVKWAFVQKLEKSWQSTI